LACPGSPKPTIDQFPGIDQFKGPIEVELEFDRISEKDKEKSAVGGFTFVDGGVEKYRVKKAWKSANSAPECWAYTPNKKPSYQFTHWPEPKTKKDVEELGPDWKALLVAAEQTAVDQKKRFTKPTRELLLNAAIELKSSLIEEVPSGPWTPYAGNSMSSVDAVLPNVVYVPALRETSEEADVGAKQSAIRKIVNSLFEQQLSGHDRVVNFKRAAIELERLFSVEGKHKIVAHVESKITSKLKELIDIGADLHFKVPDVTSDLASRTEFRVRSGDVSTRPEHQGHGAQRSIVLALLQLYAEQLRESASNNHHPMLFLIEEPEIYLHPEMCRKMRDALLRIAQSGIGQVICTTHSPVFLDLADRHDGIVIVKKTNGVPVAKQRVEDVFEQTADDKERRARLRMLLNFDPVANEVFFAEKVCLVEGDCEIAAIDATARKLHELGRISWPKYLAARRSVTVINCRGKWTIPAFQKVLRAFGLSYRVVHDEDEGQGAEKSNERIESFLSAGDSSLVHCPNFEEEIFNEKWPSDKPWKATTKINAAQEVNERLIGFFEFVLWTDIGQLAHAASDVGNQEFVAQPIQKLARRNLRHQIKEFSVSEQVIQAARRLEQVFRLAAGPNFTPAVAEGAQLAQIDGSKIHAFARVTGDSMADTLYDGDVVALKFLDSVWLEPVRHEDSKIPEVSIFKLIENDGIYVVATNDDIDQRAYTIKRIRVKALAGGGWIGQICADNPEAAWGERGLFEIRKTDRVHFAAQVIGIVKQDGLTAEGVAEAIGETYAGSGIEEVDGTGSSLQVNSGE